MVKIRFHAANYKNFYAFDYLIYYISLFHFYIVFCCLKSDLFDEIWKWLNLINIFFWLVFNKKINFISWNYITNEKHWLILIRTINDDNSFLLQLIQGLFYFLLFWIEYMIFGFPLCWNFFLKLFKVVIFFFWS